MTASVEAIRRPAASFTHLARLTDDTGLFEHARHAIVRRGHGYCTDDVARGLVVTSREPDPSVEVRRLAECYLTFLTHAQSEDGAFHNRLGHDRRWTDEPGLGDWWGRALWGLGTAAARSTVPWIRAEARVAFTIGAARRSPAPHAMAFAGLGAAEVLRADPADPVAAALLSEAAAVNSTATAGSGRTVGSAGPGGADPAGGPDPDSDWCWPHESLTYASAALAEVVIAAGHQRGDGSLLATGLRMLTWLHGIQVTGDRLSVVPVGGWRRPTPGTSRIWHTSRRRYDQQPIEVAALADACATAATVTGDPRWSAGVGQCVAWFLGDNDGGAVMWDPATGGGYDGLTSDGPNLNQGAESTLALIATLQHAGRS